MDFRVINLHVLAIPVFERHTTKVVLELSHEALNVFCSAWKDTIVRISTDGERTIKGQISGVTTRCHRAEKPNSI